ncbi:UNVERIFIED_CONTAM: hypothetical protein ABIC26_004666 [Paenibacillus sp. PvR008]
MIPEYLANCKDKIDVPGSLVFAVFILTLFAGLLLEQQVGYGDSRIITKRLAADRVQTGKDTGRKEIKDARGTKTLIDRIVMVELR